MRIVVLIKEVPDTYGERRLCLETGLVDRQASERVLDEISERSIELALTYSDAHPETEVIIVSMGPERVQATIRKGLAMGATSAVHVVDDSLVGADLGLTAEVLAAAARRARFDLIITGNASTDGGAGVIPAMLAELLNVPHATALTAVDISEGAVSGTRETDGGTMTIAAPLPAVISITDALPDGRMATFKSIVAAKKKPVETFSLADLGVVVDPSVTPRSVLVAVHENERRGKGTKIVDDGNAGARLAAFLVENRVG